MQIIVWLLFRGSIPLYDYKYKFFYNLYGYKMKLTIEIKYHKPIKCHIHRSQQPLSLIQSGISPLFHRPPHVVSHCFLQQLPFGLL